MSGINYKLYEVCFGKIGREFNSKSERSKENLKFIAKIIPNLMVFDLAYLREIGARHW